MTNATDVASLAEALIACPSVTPAAGLVFDCLEGQLAPLGFAVHRAISGTAPDGPVENLFAIRKGPVFANILLAVTDSTVNAGVFNAGTVAISNMAMCLLLAGQLRLDGVPARRTVAAWMLVLNGSGALFFALLFRLVH